MGEQVGAGVQTVEPRSLLLSCSGILRPGLEPEAQSSEVTQIVEEFNAIAGRASDTLRLRIGTDVALILDPFVFDGAYWRNKLQHLSLTMGGLHIWMRAGSQEAWLERAIEEP